MHHALPITLLVTATAAGVFFQGITTPGTALDTWFTTSAIPAIKEQVHRVQRLPFVNLLNWENGYQPRTTLRPLEVVSPAAAGYTPEEFAEIYPTN